MIEVHRRVFTDGWGLEVDWDGWILGFHRIQYPGIDHSQRFIDAWRGRVNRGFTIRVDPHGRLSSHIRCAPGRDPVALDTPPHDMLPLYAICQTVRRHGGPGEPIIDWMQDKGLL